MNPAPSVNQFVLTARIVATKVLRYTPAGLPALDLDLEHQSSAIEAGQVRQVGLHVRAVALGSVAETLVKQAIGSDWRFKGFMAGSLKNKQMVFHIQEFVQDSVQTPESDRTVGSTPNL